MISVSIALIKRVKMLCEMKCNVQWWYIMVGAQNYFLFLDKGSFKEKVNFLFAQISTTTTTTTTHTHTHIYIYICTIVCFCMYAQIEIF